MSRPPVSLSLSRRSLLFAGAAVPLAAWASVAEAGAAPASGPNKTLVCVCLRGAVDGLSIAVPHAEPEYYSVRPTLAIARPGKPDGALDLDGRFGLHPRLAALQPAFRARELALVHAVGSPHPTRSHFEAQDYLETAMPGARSANQGWLARCLSRTEGAGDHALGAVALGGRAPLALRGYESALCVKSLKQLKLQAHPPLRDHLQRGFEALYAAGDDRVSRAGKRALSFSAEMQKLVRGEYQPENGAVYAKEGRAFAEVASLIKADTGLRAAWVDIGGWDTHQQQGNAQQGTLARLFDGLAGALAALRKDLGPRFENVLVLVMTEFGRTVRENGTGGTDHGHGSVMLLYGGAVRGGRVYGQFPGLREDQRYDGRDLAVTTDYRDVLYEVAQKQLGIADPREVFPEFTPAGKKRAPLLDG